MSVTVYFSYLEFQCVVSALLIYSLCTFESKPMFSCLDIVSLKTETKKDVYTIFLACFCCHVLFNDEHGELVLFLINQTNNSFITGLLTEKNVF